MCRSFQGCCLCRRELQRIHSAKSVVEDTDSPVALEMIKNLVKDQLALVESARRVVTAAESAGDVATADLGTRRIEVHEKNAWMLRSHLE